MKQQVHPQTFIGELGRKHTERENEILQTGEREGENIDGERENGVGFKSRTIIWF